MTYCYHRAFSRVLSMMGSSQEGQMHTFILFHGVHFLGREDPLEKEMAIHSSTLAWKIPWTEEPDWLQSMGLQRVGYD